MTEKDVIGAVKKMRPTVYRYNKNWLDDGKQHFGFIAQELEEIFPSDDFGIVAEDENGNKMVRYHEVIPMLVKYINHLEERVKNLEKNVEDDLK